ncbi:hypothetical protein [Rheinheimera sp. 4Y26]|uniref:hypothetical protein n=1 Tax=Rheinheimera sp. 4Y26 TaxID=2977811 RepID=UPI0021B0E6A8|nr:hypothetical protein [Rheinheimera sp. 4Y26]MCT6699217.1 hypothetical protein [Rheinheimera sp. 4Y26]
MLTTVQLLDRLGRDASFEKMTQDEKVSFIRNNSEDPLVAQAIIDSDVVLLSNLIYAGKKGCYLLVPAEDEKEAEDAPEQKDDKVSFQ